MMERIFPFYLGQKDNFPQRPYGWLCNFFVVDFPRRPSYKWSVQCSGLSFNPPALILPEELATSVLKY